MLSHLHYTETCAALLKKSPINISSRLKLIFRMQLALFEVFVRTCSLCGGAFTDRMKAVQGFGFSPDEFSERRGAGLC